MVIYHTFKYILLLLLPYVKDTDDFLFKINSTNDWFPDLSGTFLVTINAISLYTNIPVDEGLKAVESFLNSYSCKVLPTAAITAIFDWVLRYNSFTFSDKHFIQADGTAMGSCVSPIYANLFMGKFEKKHTCPAASHLIEIYWRRFYYFIMQPIITYFIVRSPQLATRVIILAILSSCLTLLSLFSPANLLLTLLRSSRTNINTSILRVIIMFKRHSIYTLNLHNLCAFALMTMILLNMHSKLHKTS